MKDELETLSDGKLSEVFAVEVAGWKDVNTTHWQKPDAEQDHWNRFAPLPAFATSADAVLPFFFSGPGWGEFNKHTITGDTISAIEQWRVRFKPLGINGFIEGIAPTFARAACLALIRAKRAAKL